MMRPRRAIYVLPDEELELDLPGVTEATRRITITLAGEVCNCAGEPDAPRIIATAAVDAAVAMLLAAYGPARARDEIAKLCAPDRLEQRRRHHAQALVEIDRIC